MKTISRIFLGIAGALCLLVLLLNVVGILISWLITLFNVVYRGIIIVCLIIKADPEVIEGLLTFIQYANPLTGLLFMMLGLTGSTEISYSTLMVIMIVQCVIYIFECLITTLGLVIPLFLFFLNTLFSFIGMGAKKGKGVHIFNIILGALSYIYLNELAGTLMLVGGVLAVINDGKVERRERREREEREKKEAARLMLVKQQ